MTSDTVTSGQSNVSRSPRSRRRTIVTSVSKTARASLARRRATAANGLNAELPDPASIVRVAARRRDISHLPNATSGVFSSPSDVGVFVSELVSELPTSSRSPPSPPSAVSTNRVVLLFVSSSSGYAVLQVISHTKRRTSGRSRKASGVELKGVAGGR